MTRSHTETRQAVIAFLLAVPVTGLMLIATFNMAALTV